MLKMNRTTMSVFLVLLVLLLPEIAGATTTSGTSWDTPLSNFRNAITGPIAYTISISAIIVSGAMLAFGGEINEFARRMIMMVLVVALVMLAIQFLTQLWGASGAEIIAPEATLEVTKSHLPLIMILPIVALVTIVIQFLNQSRGKHQTDDLAAAVVKNELLMSE